MRVVETRRPLATLRLALELCAVAAILAGIGYFALMPPASRPGVANPTVTDRAHDASIDSGIVPVDAQRLRTPARAAPAGPIRLPGPSDEVLAPDDLPVPDPNDIANYVSATDPVPTAGEIIQALHDIGDHTGIGAFNPPGTSPPLRGIAVPEDFVLPEGYVRHYQVTDEGEPIDPILMFSPDVVFLDAAGREIPIPENRVVPPDMAPPGLPIREIDIPPSP